MKTHIIIYTNNYWFTLLCDSYFYRSNSCIITTTNQNFYHFLYLLFCYIFKIYKIFTDVLDRLLYKVSSSYLFYRYLCVLLSLFYGIYCLHSLRYLQPKQLDIHKAKTQQEVLINILVICGIIIVTIQLCNLYFANACLSLARIIMLHEFQ